MKVKPQKKFGHYQPDHVVQKIILNIKDDEYKDIALLMYSTGARAREIITLKEENIDFDYKDKIIRLRLIGKGQKQRFTYTNSKLKNILEKYCSGKAGYLFIHNSDDNQELEKLINNKRTYLYNRLFESSDNLGFGHFGTHDFRRNVAQKIRRNTNDIFLVKKILGHVNINTTMRYFDQFDPEIENSIIKHQKELSD